ncbi:MAG: hypothetical protein KDC44_24245, partial [Phaeodactylibacter sp.]|nr:hypothetical protein [Phaeodactylibacter sp.]
KRTLSEKQPFTGLLSGRIEQIAKHPSGPFFCSSHDTVFVFSSGDLERRHHGAHFQLPLCKDQYGDSIRNHVEKIAPVPESFDLVWVMGRQGIHLFERKARSSWELRRSYQNDPSQFERAFAFLGNKVHDFFVENADRIWLGTDEGLFLFDGIQRQSDPIIADVNITAVAEPVQLDFFKYRIWVAGNRGFSDQYIWAIDYEPRDDKVRIRPSQVQSFAVGGTAKGFIFDIIATERGDVWLGMEQIVRFKDIGKTQDWSFYQPETHQLYYNVADGFEGTHALTLQEQADGRVWVGSPEGVYTVKPGVTMDVIDQSLVSCSGKKDGRFTLRVVDGEPPYQFLLDSVRVPGIRRVQLDSATIAFEGLPSGTYKILATDRLRQDTGQLNVVLEEPEPLHARLVKYRRPSYTGRRDGVMRVEDVSGGRVASETDFISGKSY